MRIILNADQITKVINSLTGDILSQIRPEQEIAVIGVRSRGVVLANRLTERLSKKLGRPIPCGSLDITLYRDDLDDSRSSDQPKVRVTEIDFDVTDKTIILADDVLYTGRSARAAMDALIDFGRPKAIKLAVLIDRGGRELPIQADYVGFKADVADDESVSVNFIESDGRDQVVVE